MVYKMLFPSFPTHLGASKGTRTDTHRLAWF
jgi:hypothetical protein